MKHFLYYFYSLILFLLTFSETEAQDKTGDKPENVVTRLVNRISGIVNMRYQYSDADEGVNSFDIRRARISFKGDVTPSVDYHLNVEFAGNPKILDAFVNWHSIDAFNIKAGEFKVPFSLENPYSVQAYEMVDNSLVIIGLSGYNDVSGISSNGRDIGVNFHGKFFPVEDYSVFEYSVGLFNGNGINVSDNNKSKDFAGTFYAHPLKEITLSISHYNGSAGLQGENIQRVRTGGGLRYVNNKLLVRSEYIYGKTGDINSDGYYIVAGYFVHPKIQTLLKYDYFRRNISAKETWQTNYIAGINYFPVKNFQFKLNYSFRTTVGSPDVNHVALQFFALF
ncbi:MAG: OprO/OprP family phosphate-selective porin [Prevotellaceae bacterium]|jgi:phosphate-selective porin|nr:OprO/OprP family phosphate-selective porin [Prevotellaceae bacterium]